jgi:hypothetical protein
VVRNHFNTGDFAGALGRGELLEGLWSDRHLRKPRKEPYCTRSQVLIYWTPERTPVAMVHQYVRPDGSLGASGRPDPKLVVIGDTVYGTKG